MLCTPVFSLAPLEGLGEACSFVAVVREDLLRPRHKILHALSVGVPTRDEKLQILQAVVGAVPVAVVDRLALAQLAPQMFRHDKPVL